MSLKISFLWHHLNNRERNTVSSVLINQTFELKIVDILLSISNNICCLIKMFRNKKTYFADTVIGFEDKLWLNAGQK